MNLLIIFILFFKNELTGQDGLTCILSCQIDYCTGRTWMDW